MLYDFAASFPSLARAYVWMALAYMGLPPYVIRALQALYADNKHFFGFGGLMAFAFIGLAGVRQGCPASSTLFAIVTDPIIRALLMRLPRSCLLRAYADDIAMVFWNFWVQALCIAAMFLGIGSISCLFLKSKKCVAIMLWKSNEGACRILLREMVPSGAAFSIAEYGEYLGYIIGPGANDSSWRGPAAKYIDRCKYIRQLGLDFILSMYHYKVLAFSCMQFVAQLAQVPKWVLKLERQGLDIITGGPTNWLHSQTLSCLDEFVGFHFVVPSLELVCNATIARTALVSVLNWRGCAAIMDGGWADDERALLPGLPWVRA